MSWVIESCSVCREDIKSWHELTGHRENCGHRSFERVEKKEMTLDEKVFRKMGWTQTQEAIREGIGVSFVYFWKPPGLYDFNRLIKELPPISSSWEVCAEYLVPFMGGKGYEWTAQGFKQDSNVMHFLWWGDEDSSCAKIKDDNIALAACEAFMEVIL